MTVQTEWLSRSRAIIDVIHLVIKIIFDIFPYLKNSGKQWYIFITRREIGGSLTHELLSMVVRLVPTGQNQRLLTLLLPLYKRKVTVVWQDSHRTLITSTLCAYFYAIETVKMKGLFILALIFTITCKYFYKLCHIYF